MTGFLSFVFMAGYIAGNSFPKPLSAEDEKKYVELYKNGDEEAKNILIKHNLRLVAHIAKKYAANGYDSDDLISIGTIGLIKGIMSYNSDKNVRLATYSAKCIENEILMFIRSSKKYSNDLYLQDSIGHDHDGNEIAMIDILSADNENIADRVDLKIKIKNMYDEISESLDDRERVVLILRYGLDNNDELTQREIAEKLNISRSYVSRIEKKAIKKLSDKMK